MSRTIRVGALSCVIAAALFFVWWGVAVASKVFADYKDSTDATYLTAGGIFFAFALGVVVLTLMTRLPQHMSRSQLLISLPIGVILLAVLLGYLYYGPPSDRPGPEYHRGTFATPAPGLDPRLATPSIGTPLPLR